MSSFKNPKKKQMSSISAKSCPSVPPSEGNLGSRPSWNHDFSFFRPLTQAEISKKWKVVKWSDSALGDVNSYLFGSVCGRTFKNKLEIEIALTDAIDCFRRNQSKKKNAIILENNLQEYNRLLKSFCGLVSQLGQRPKPETFKNRSHKKLQLPQTKSKSHSIFSRSYGHSNISKPKNFIKEKKDFCWQNNSKAICPLKLIEEKKKEKEEEDFWILASIEVAQILDKPKNFHQHQNQNQNQNLQDCKETRNPADWNEVKKEEILTTQTSQQQIDKTRSKTPDTPPIFGERISDDNSKSSNSISSIPKNDDDDELKDFFLTDSPQRLTLPENPINNSKQNVLLKAKTLGEPKRKTQKESPLKTASQTPIDVDSMLPALEFATPPNEEDQEVLLSTVAKKEHQKKQKKKKRTQNSVNSPKLQSECGEKPKDPLSPLLTPPLPFDLSQAKETNQLKKSLRQEEKQDQTEIPWSPHPWSPDEKDANSKEKTNSQEQSQENIGSQDEYCAAVASQPVWESAQDPDSWRSGYDGILEENPKLKSKKNKKRKNLTKDSRVDNNQENDTDQVVSQPKTKEKSKKAKTKKLKKTVQKTEIIDLSYLTQSEK